MTSQEYIRRVSSSSTGNRDEEGLGAVDMSRILRIANNLLMSPYHHDIMDLRQKGREAR